MKKLLVLLFIVSPLLTLAQNFDKDLYYGIQSDSAVKSLQEFLIAQGVYSGPISGNFFSLTLQGVKAFQTKQGISPISGYFGPKSRLAANQILALEGVSASGVQDESGSTTPVIVAQPKNTNDVVASLLAQMKLLQQQLDALQTQQQTLQTIQQQQIIQNQALQQIQQNTTPTPTPIPSATPTPLPTPTPMPVQLLITSAPYTYYSISNGIIQFFKAELRNTYPNPVSISSMEASLKISQQPCLECTTPASVSYPFKMLSFGYNILETASTFGCNTLPVVSSPFPLGGSAEDVNQIIILPITITIPANSSRYIEFCTQTRGVHTGVTVITNITSVETSPINLNLDFSKASTTLYK